MVYRFIGRLFKKRKNNYYGQLYKKFYLMLFIIIKLNEYLIKCSPYYVYRNIKGDENIYQILIIQLFLFFKLYDFKAEKK